MASAECKARNLATNSQPKWLALAGLMVWVGIGCGQGTTSAVRQRDDVVVDGDYGDGDVLTDGGYGDLGPDGGGGDMRDGGGGDMRDGGGGDMRDGGGGDMGDGGGGDMRDG